MILDKSTELDRGIELFAKVIPKLLKGLYTGLIQEGFSEAQALFLTSTYLSSLTNPQREE